MDVNLLTALSPIQIDYLQGALLGDGSLYIHKNANNACFCYTSKSYQHVKYVSDPFSELSTSGIVHRYVFDNRTNKIYSINSFRTKVNPSFTEEYYRWYKNGVKHLPDNLVLNPTVCLIWYIGDGGISISKNSCYLKLSTHCFSKEEQEQILLPQLKDFCPKLYKTGISKNGDIQHFIGIPRKKASDFLEYIGKYPFEDYAYKWDLPKYKNFSIDNDPQKIDEIIKLFHMGCSSGTIAKIVNVDRSTVMKYLSLNGLDYRDNLFSKVKPSI